MRLAWTALLLVGCAHTVNVSVPPAPALTGLPERVAVVVGPGECHDVATSLVASLRDDQAFVLDPTAPLQLEVLDCDASMRPPTVEVVLSETQDQRRVQIEGRAHAIIGVRVGGSVAAHLIGAAHRTVAGGWGQTNVRALSRGVARDLNQGVADDIAAQLRPIPRVVARRVYPNAPEDSPRGWLNQAVAAERAGDLDEAVRLVALAQERRPTAQLAAYRAELERRRTLRPPRQ
jgi:hypothetical protein